MYAKSTFIPLIWSFLTKLFCCTITCIGRHTCQRKIGCSARFTFLNSCLLYLIVLTSFNVSKKKRKYFFYENKNNALTGFGLESRRKVFKSPPARSSNTMKRGCLSKQTPMKWTMLGWLNFDMISASIRKSISAWLELSSGNVFTATAISDESVFKFFLK